MNTIIYNPMFGILLSLLAFEIGLYIQKKTKWLILNPLLVSIVFIMIILVLFQIDLEAYQVGGNMINMLLGPATVVLAVPLYQQIQNLKHFALPILMGVLIGSICAMVSTLICCWIFQLDTSLMASLLPKSITTPIGIAVSAQLGGIPAITVMAILVTGIMGSIMADIVFRIFKLDHPIARGIALGTSAHAVGTTKAISLGKVEGAMSSLAIGLSGIITVLVAPFIWNIMTSFFL